MNSCQWWLLIVTIATLLVIALETYAIWRVRKLRDTIVAEIVPVLKNRTVCSSPGCEAFSCSDEPVDGLPMPSVPTNRSFDIVTSNFLCDLIMRVALESDREVHHRKDADIPPPNAQLQIAAKYRETNGELAAVLYVTVGGGPAYLAWKGSTTKYDFFSDGNFGEVRTVILNHSLQNPMRYIQGKLPVNLESGAESNICLALQRPLLVHGGFESIYAEMRDRIFADIAAHKPTFLFVAGHSLGGALSNLFALDVLVNNPSSYRFVLYTYGCPRVGTQAFADAFKEPGTQALQVFFTVQNTSDLVPDLPLAVMPNPADCARPNLFTHAGTIVRVDDNWASVMLTHSIPCYIKAINEELKYQATKDETTDSPSAQTWSTN